MPSDIRQPLEPGGANSPGPLAGVRILTLAQQLPGPYATRLLADLGAEVIMVEQVTAGDPGRSNQAIFDLLSRDKSSVSLDLKSAAGHKAFLELASSARIVLEGFRPGVAARLGVAYDDVRAVRPDVVYCSISAFGQDTLLAQVPAHDLSIQAQVGLVDPLRFDAHDTGLPLADLVAGMHAALLVASYALAGQEPVYLDLSMTDALASWASILQVPAWAGVDSPFVDNPNPGYGVYRTSDGWITLSIAFEDHFWSSLCSELGLERFATLTHAERGARYDELSEHVTARLATKSTDHWLRVLRDAEVPAGPVNSPESVLRDETLIARGIVRSASDDSVDVRTPASRLDPRTREAHGPSLGQHNHLVSRSAGTAKGNA